MRVVTWNIQFGLQPDLAARELLGLAELADADIVLLQEMDRPGAAAIAAELGADFVFAAAAIFPGTGRELGNAIISRWPISAPRELALPHTARVGGQPRSAITATVDVAGRPTHVYSAHTETPLLGLARRSQQFATIADDVAARPNDEPIIVGGDFNTAMGREVRALARVMTSAGLEHASGTSGPTLRRFGRDFTLDHVFARRLEPAASGVARSATASDHAPVWADFTS